MDPGAVKYERITVHKSFQNKKQTRNLRECISKACWCVHVNDLGKDQERSSLTVNLLIWQSHKIVDEYQKH